MPRRGRIEGWKPAFFHLRALSIRQPWAWPRNAQFAIWTARLGMWIAVRPVQSMNHSYRVQINPIESRTYPHRLLDVWQQSRNAECLPYLISNLMRLTVYDRSLQSFRRLTVPRAT